MFGERAGHKTLDICSIIDETQEWTRDSVVSKSRVNYFGKLEDRTIGDKKPLKMNDR